MRNCNSMIWPCTCMTLTDRNALVNCMNNSNINACHSFKDYIRIRMHTTNEPYKVLMIVYVYTSIVYIRIQLLFGHTLAWLIKSATWLKYKSRLYRWLMMIHDDSRTLQMLKTHETITIYDYLTTFSSKSKCLCPYLHGCHRQSIPKKAPVLCLLTTIYEFLYAMFLALPLSMIFQLLCRHFSPLWLQDILLFIRAIAQHTDIAMTITPTDNVSVSVHGRFNNFLTALNSVRSAQGNAPSRFTNNVCRNHAEWRDRKWRTSVVLCRRS